MTSPADSERTARLAWPDVARGLSVALIVLLHLWVSHLIFWIGDESVLAAIAAIVDWTSPLRIPLFFFVSGYLASRSLHRPWRTAWRARVLSTGYLYLLWVAIIAVFVWVDGRANGFATENPALLFLQNLFAPTTHMWYLWALIVLFVLVWATRRLPGWTVVSFGAVVSIVAPFLLEQPYRQVAAAVLFYVLGARLPMVTEWLTSRRGVWAFVAGAGVYVVSILLGPTGPYGLADPLTSAVGVAATVAVVGAVAHQRWMRVLLVLGRNSLPIFILNPLLFILFNDVLRSIPEAAVWINEHPGGADLYVVGVLVATLAMSIGLKMAADRIGLRWLFALPDGWFRASARRA